MALFRHMLTKLFTLDSEYSNIREYQNLDQVSKDSKTNLIFIWSIGSPNQTFQAKKIIKSHFTNTNTKTSGKLNLLGSDFSLLNRDPNSIISMVLILDSCPGHKNLLDISNAIQVIIQNKNVSRILIFQGSENLSEMIYVKEVEYSSKSKLIFCLANKQDYNIMSKRSGSLRSSNFYGGSSPNIYTGPDLEQRMSRSRSTSRNTMSDTENNNLSIQDEIPVFEYKPHFKVNSPAPFKTNSGISTPVTLSPRPKEKTNIINQSFFGPRLPGPVQINSDEDLIKFSQMQMPIHKTSMMHNNSFEFNPEQDLKDFILENETEIFKDNDSMSEISNWQDFLMNSNLSLSLFSSTSDNDSSKSSGSYQKMSKSLSLKNLSQKDLDQIISVNMNNFLDQNEGLESMEDDLESLEEQNSSSFESDNSMNNPSKKKTSTIRLSRVPDPFMDNDLNIKTCFTKANRLSQSQPNNLHQIQDASDKKALLGFMSRFGGQKKKNVNTIVPSSIQPKTPETENIIKIPETKKNLSRLQSKQSMRKSGISNLEMNYDLYVKECVRQNNLKKDSESNIFKSMIERIRQATNPV